MKPLSARQQQLYDYIDSFAKKNYYAPSIDEIAENLGLGRSTVVAHLSALHKKKYVRWQEGQPRTLRVIPMPGTAL